MAILKKFTIRLFDIDVATIAIAHPREGHNEIIRGLVAKYAQKLRTSAEEKSNNG